MRAMSKLWHDCANYVISRNEWEYQRRITIAGVVYSDDQILSVEQSRGVIDGTLSIGNTVSSELIASFIPNDVPQEINLEDEVKLEVRIKTLYDGATEWFPFGTFYIDEAVMDGVYLKISCFDKLAFLNKPFKGGSSISSSEALDIILSEAGLTLDNRSVLGNYQLKNANRLTSRQVLGYIGSLNAGNWYVTEENKLRHIVPGVNPNSILTIGKDNTKKLATKPIMSFGKITVKTSTDQAISYSAGSGPGEFEVYNPWGNQDMADRILSVMNGYKIYPGDVGSTEINPAIEIGDTITVDGNKVQLSLVNYNARMFLSLVSPTKTDKFHQNMDVVNDVKKEPEPDSCKVMRNEDFKVNGSTFIFDQSIGGYYKNSDHYCVRIEDGNKIEIDKLSQGLSISTGSKDDSLPRKVVMKKPLDVWVKFQNSRYDIELDIYDFNSSGITNMSQMFSTSSSSEPIDISNLDTRSARSMSRMFYGVQRDSLKLSNFNTSKVENMDEMFGGFGGVILDISSFDTSKVESMASMFNRCKVESDVKFNFVTNNVKSFVNMFANSEFVNIDLSTFRFYRIALYEETSSYTGPLSRMFYRTKANKLIMPETFININKPYTISKMFSSDIVEVDASKITMSVSSDFEIGLSTNELYSPFLECSSRIIKLPKYNFDEVPQEMKSNVERALFTYMFQDCYNLETLIQQEPLPPCRYMFRNTPNLKGTIDLSMSSYEGNPAIALEMFENSGIEKVLLKDYYSRENMSNYFEQSESGVDVYYLKFEDGKLIELEVKEEEL